MDFEVETDFLGLAEGLTLADLSLTPNGRNALIASGEETLAILKGVAVADLTAANFTVF